MIREWWNNKRETYGATNKGKVCIAMFVVIGGGSAIAPMSVYPLVFLSAILSGGAWLLELREGE